MDAHDLNHFNKSEKYVNALKKQYHHLINDVVKIAVGYDIDTQKPFNFDDYPALKKEVEKLLNDFAKKSTAIIEIGRNNAWKLGVRKVGDIIGQSVKGSWQSAVSSRQLAVSERVWNLTEQYKGELEMALDLGIGNGKSANEIAREIKKYLNQPDQLFRRVRDKHGNLHLSKKAKEYHPGQGIYRSSYKNAQRLARTETNIAYHSAIYEKYQEFDFVVGIEIRLSNNPNHCPFCSAMAGKYPKDFKFTGWHPNCRCTTIPILAKNIDQIQENEKVKDLPPAMTKWIQENQNKIKSAKNKPYFIRDNEKKVEKVGMEIEKEKDIKRKDKEDVRKIDIGKFIKGENNKFTPKEISKYEENLGVKIDRRIFEHLQKETPLLFTNPEGITGSGAYYSPYYNAVKIPIDNRRKASKWYAEAVVYHEFGHAADNHIGLKQNPIVIELMNKHIKSIDFKAVDERVAKFGRYASRRGNHDLIEKVGAVRDTIMSLNPNYGMGHTKAYYKQAGNRQAEFIAHAFENTYAGNNVFKKVLPELYEDMIKLIEKTKLK